MKSKDCHSVVGNTQIFLGVLFFLIGFFSHSLSSAKDMFIEGDTFNISLRQDSNIQILRLTGTFSSGSYKKAKAIFNSLEPNKTVVMDLSFGGGSERPIKKFINDLNAFVATNNVKIITLVRSQANCASFCLLIYMTGQTRIAFPDSLFGFHAAYYEFMGITTTATSIMVKNYSDYGVNKTWLENNRQLFNSIFIQWLRTKNLEGSDIVNILLLSERDLESYSPLLNSDE